MKELKVVREMLDNVKLDVSGHSQRVKELESLIEELQVNGWSAIKYQKELEVEKMLLEQGEAEVLHLSAAYLQIKSQMSNIR